MSPARGFARIDDTKLAGSQPTYGIPVSSPRSNKYGSSGSSRRRFFGLSEAAEAETEAAASILADRMAADGGSRGGQAGHATAGYWSTTSIGDDGRAREVINAHRMVVALRSEPMRAMLRSGEL